jgi:hypothetical protein
LCSECGRRLRAEVADAGTLGRVNLFDDRVGSGTNTERVSHCPGCNLWLYDGPSVEPGEVAQRR